MTSYFDSLPSDIQDVLTSDGLSSQISQICKENGASEKVKSIQEVCTATLMALQPIKGFVGRIAAATNIPAVTAQNIADKINENIFRPVRQSLIKIHEIPPSEQAAIPAIEPHFEHLLEIHSPDMIALAKPAVTTATTSAPKTLAEQKMSRPTSLPPQISRTDNEPDPYREPLA